jgi:hypothetical protein
MKRNSRFNSAILIFSGISLYIAVEILFPFLVHRVLAYSLGSVLIILGILSLKWNITITDTDISQNAMWRKWSYKWSEIDCAIIKKIDNGYNVRLVIGGSEVVLHTIFIDDQVIEMITKNCRVITRLG